MKDWVLKDYYRILGISPDSSEGQIKQAYRRLVRENHPDYNPQDPDCEERLREINESYEALTDSTMRRRVDRFLSGMRRPNFPKADSIYFSEQEAPYSHEETLIQEWDRTQMGSKWFVLFSLPTAIYLVLGYWELLHLVLRPFVILFVGTFYVALFFGAKAIFHGTTVLAMKVPNGWRTGAQVMIPVFLFVMPLNYFAGDWSGVGSAVHSFTRHTWDWFLFATIIIGLTWLFGIFFRSPLVLRFPFRLSVLAVFLTFVIAFCKAIPLVDKSEVLFDYIFFNLTMQTGLVLAIRWNHQHDPNP